MIIQRIKLGMLLFGCIFGTIIGVRELAIALLESEPTRFDIARFQTDYADQQWIEVRGQLARAHAGVRPGTHSTHRRDGLGYVHVPVVASGWTPGEPVSVLATFGPIPLDEPIDWDALCDGPACVSGQVRPVPINDLDELLPGLPVVEEPVVVNVGTEPAAPVGMAVFTAVMLLVALGSAAALRNRDASPDPPSAT